MKRIRSLAILIVLTLGLLVFDVQPALAFPPLPSTFYGTVKIDEANVPAGTVVSAQINDVKFAFATVITYHGDIVYSLDIPGDDSETTGIIEGGVEGDTIVFYIGTTKATQTAIWHGGPLVSLNLTGHTDIEPLAFTTFLLLILR